MPGLSTMRSAPRDGHPRVAKSTAGTHSRSVDKNGIVYYADSDEEAADTDHYKVLSKKGQRKVRRENEEIKKQLKSRENYSRQVKSAWQEKEEKKSKERTIAGNKNYRKGNSKGQQRPKSATTRTKATTMMSRNKYGEDDGEDSDDLFDDLAKTVRSKSKTAPARPKSAHTSSRSTPSGDVVGKVRKLEKTVEVLSRELEEARELVAQTREQQAENQKAAKIDENLEEKLNSLKVQQEKNVKVIETLIKQRDMAEAKAKRIEKVLIDDVESLSITIDEEKIDALSKPKAASSPSPRKKQTQREGETDEEYERRIARRHKSLVKPFRSMEIHEAVTRKKKLLSEELEARKRQKEDALRKKERLRREQGMQAGEFSFASRDREAAKQKEEEVEKKRIERKETEKSLQFKARPVKLYFTENWDDIAQRQDAERKQRVAARAAQIQSTSQLPARMAMHAALTQQEGHQEKESAAERTKKRLAEKEAKKHFKPKIDPEHYTAIMHTKQAKWQEKLQATKDAVRAHATVAIGELPIERRQREYEEKRTARLAREAKRQAKIKAERDEAERIAREKALSSNVAPPRPTNAHTQKVKKIADDRARRQERLEQEKREEERRKRRQDRVNAEVRQMVEEMDRERKANYPGTFVEMAGANEKAEQQRKEKEAEAKERQQKLRNRLIEVQKKHKADGGIIGATEKCIKKQKAKRRALGVVADAVYGGAYGGQGGTVTKSKSGGRINNSWKARANQDDLFDDSEKAYLGIGETDGFEDWE